MASQPPVIFNAFWEGTANTLNPPTTQISLFAAACVGDDVQADSSCLQDGEGPFKMAFDGCGVTNGITGTLFASGLREEAATVAGHVNALVARGRNVVLNAYGLSRGGIAVIYLLQQLEDANPSSLTINAMLFDPVPGDQVRSGFPWTGRNAKDVSGCAALQRVLAIYPHEPLPWISFHAPLLVSYPPNAMVEEDVWPGCHQGALFNTGKSRNPMTIASNLSFRRIADFCEAVGTRLQRLDRIFGFQPAAAQCLKMCEDILAVQAPTRRELHDGPGQGRTIVRRETGKYLNKYHEALVERPGSCAAADWRPNASVDRDSDGGYMLGFDGRS